MTLLVGLVCLALGIALGWFGHRRKVRGVGTPTPKPDVVGPSLDEQAHRAAVLATRAVEHAEWARQYPDWEREADMRRWFPPPPGVVWQRRPHKITDFNN